MASYLIIFLLFLLQFVYFPVDRGPFEESKVYVVEIAVFLLVLLQLFSKQGFLLRQAQYKKGFLWSLAILFLLSVYHVFFSQSPTVLFGNTFRLQGTLLLWFLILFALLSFDRGHIKIKKIFVAGVIVIQFICSVFFVGANVDRAIGTLGEPNTLAATMLFLWPFLFFPKPKKRLEWLLVIGSLLLVILIITMTGSRSGMIALVVQLGFLLSFYKLRKSLRWSTGLALILLLLSFVTPFLTPGNLYENRGEVWVSALHAGLSSPLVGVGFGNIEYALHDSNVALGNHLPGFYVDSAHNIFLDWWVAGGVIGLGILLYLVYATITIFFKKQNVLHLVLFLGLITALSFNPASVVSLVALWWLLGQGGIRD